MNTDNSDIVLASINGQSILTNMKSEIKRLAGSVLEILSELTIVPGYKYRELRKKVVQDLTMNLAGLLEIYQKFTSFNEMMEATPRKLHLFHSRAKNMPVHTCDEPHRYLQIGHWAIMIPPKDDLRLSFTLEEAQDYVTLRYKEEPLSVDEYFLVRKMETLDRHTVMRLWKDGYPVHMTRVPFTDEMLRVFTDVSSDIAIYLMPEDYVWTKDRRLTKRKKVDGEKVTLGKWTYGWCVPDHTCCNQDGMFETDYREVVYNSTEDQRDLIQSENLVQRMRQMVDQRTQEHFKKLDGK